MQAANAAISHWIKNENRLYYMTTDKRGNLKIHE